MMACLDAKRTFKYFCVVREKFIHYRNGIFSAVVHKHHGADTIQNTARILAEMIAKPPLLSLNFRAQLCSMPPESTSLSHWSFLAMPTPTTKILVVIAIKPPLFFCIKSRNSYTSCGEILFIRVQISFSIGMFTYNRFVCLSIRPDIKFL